MAKLELVRVRALRQERPVQRAQRGVNPVEVAAPVRGQKTVGQADFVDGEPTTMPPDTLVLEGREPAVRSSQQPQAGQGGLQPRGARQLDLVLASNAARLSWLHETCLSGLDWESDFEEVSR